MPLPRLATKEQLDLAVDDLVRLGSRLHQLSVVADPGSDRVSFHRSDGTGWSAKVLAYDAVSESLVRQLFTTEARGQKVVVANRISDAARAVLASKGWSWLDRRIGAYIARTDGSPGIEVLYTERRGHDPDSPLRRFDGPAADGPIRGRAGIAYAAAVLCNPEKPPSFRSVAEAAGMSPTSISNAASRLTDAGLLGPDNRPTLPDLFWTLAQVWSPLKVAAVAAVPRPDDAQFRPNLASLDEPGWVLGGDVAAAALGAPVFSTDDRPWLWLPTQVELRRAERAYGPTAWADRVAVIAAPPTPLLCRRRRPPRQGSPWPLPHPVFAALDLARDPGRGREILTQWTHPEGADPVWL